MSALRRVSAVEYEVWDSDRDYRVAVIRKVQIGHPITDYWRSVTGDQDPAARNLLGYFPTLEFATHVTWRLWDQHSRIPVEQQYV